MVKSVRDIIEIGKAAESASEGKGKKLTPTSRKKLIDTLIEEMKDASARLEFEQAAFLRDKIRALREEKG